MNTQIQIPSAEQDPGLQQVGQEALEAVRAAQNSGNGNIQNNVYTSIYPKSSSESASLPVTGQLVVDVEHGTDAVNGVDANFLTTSTNGPRRAIDAKLDLKGERPSTVTVERYPKVNGRIERKVITYTDEKAERLGAAAVKGLTRQIKVAAEQ